MLPNDPNSQSAWTVPLRLQIAFDVVAVVSSLSMTLFLVTARLDPRIHRSKAWYAMFITLSIFPLLYLLNIAYQFRSGDPPFGLCIFQAASIYAGELTDSVYNQECLQNGHRTSSVRQSVSHTKPTELKGFYSVSSAFLVYMLDVRAAFFLNSWIL